LNLGRIVDIPCTPDFYKRYLHAKEGLDELFDITFLREHQLAEKFILSEAAGSDGSQHTTNCKLTREGLQTHSCTQAYDEMIKDHGCDEDICMRRLIVKQNIEALPQTEVLRRHEIVRDEKKLEMKEADADDSMICWEGPKTRNEGRRPFAPFAAQGRPASVADKKPRPEELDPTVDPSSTTGTKKSASSSVAAAATSAATLPTGFILTNENHVESSGVSGTAAIGGILEAASAQAGRSNTGIQVQVKGPPVIVKKKTKQAKKYKSAEIKTIAELLSEVLSSDAATVEGALSALLEKRLRKNRRKELRDEVLKRAPLGSRFIKLKACQLLIAISHECEDIKRIILNPDGLVLIVNAMKANIGSVDLQHAACNALHRLGKWESDQEKLLHAGVIATLIST
jgi:hypothetical protein